VLAIHLMNDWRAEGQIDLPVHCPSAPFSRRYYAALLNYSLLCTAGYCKPWLSVKHRTQYKSLMCVHFQIILAFFAPV